LSERGGVYNLACANLVVALLAMLGEGTRRWVPTRWYLHFSCFSFRLSYLHFSLVCLC
jgi:hypothetical protein